MLVEQLQERGSRKERDRNRQREREIALLGGCC